MATNTQPDIETIGGQRAANLPFLEYFSDPETKKRQLDAFLYVERMSALLSIDISSWPLHLLQVGLFDIRLIEDKPRLNQILLDNMKIYAAKNALPPDMEKAFRKAEVAFSEAKAGLLTSLRLDHQTAMRYVRQYQTSVSEQIEEAWAKQRQISMLEGTGPEKIGEELRKILINSFFKFEGLGPFSGYGNRHDVIYTTTTPVSMSLVNKSAGVDILVTFGKFIVAVNLAKMRVTVHPFNADNPLVGTYYHPYVSDTGAVCWGNAADTANNLLAKGDLSAVMGLLSAVLTTYSPDSTPYQSLEDFYKVQQARHGLGKKRPANRAWCDECDEERSCCACGDWCGTCDGHYDDCECKTCEVCGYTGSEHCPEHWCRHCEAYSRGDCGCCDECGETDGDHTEDCSEYEEPESETQEEEVEE